MTRIDITDTLEYKTKLPKQGIEESNLEYLRRVQDITSVMDVLKDMTNIAFLNMMGDNEGNSSYTEYNKILYYTYSRLLKDQERLLKKAGEWNK
jgi:hypothetical protein